MSLEITGKVTHILKQESGISKNNKEWTKQTFVILEEADQYPKSIAIDVFNDKVNIPAIGTKVKAFINIDSREYNGKWYSNIGAWKMEVLGEVIHETPPLVSEENNELESDNLPF